MGHSSFDRNQGRWDAQQQMEHEAIQEEKRRLASPAYHRRKVGGSSLIGLGATIGLAHWFDHAGAVAILPSYVAEVGGYPAAAVLAAWGSVKLFRPAPRRRQRA